jgi:hypothetical protein
VEGGKKKTGEMSDTRPRSVSYDSYCSVTVRVHAKAAQIMAAAFKV